MDPLSITTAVLDLSSAAYSSAKALIDLIDDIKNAPKTVKDFQSDLDQLQKVLDSLTAVAKKEGDAPALAPVFDRVGLQATLTACDQIVSDFRETLKKYTKHSTDGEFSKRDRLTVTFKKSKLEAFRTKLSLARGLIAEATRSATFAVTVSIHDATDDMKQTMAQQEATLKAISAGLTKFEASTNDLEINPDDENDPDNDVIGITTSERDLTLRVLPDLMKTCVEAGAVTKALISMTEQKFGDISMEGNAVFAAGVAGSNLGKAHVKQEFGKLEAKGSSRGFAGRMGSEEFKALFGSGGPVKPGVKQP